LTTRSAYSGPNEEFLDAQARVCTGPHQSRPLGLKPGDPDPHRILELILQSVSGELPWADRVSDAQIGAFLAAMALRRRFSAETAWSPAETEAFCRHTDQLARSLPPALGYLLDPAGDFTPANADEALLVSAFAQILRGDHLTYQDTRSACEAILRGKVHSGLAAAILIGQRMNRETHEEVRGYLDAAFDPARILPLRVPTVTHFGEPYNGSTRMLRPTLFVAAVRAALGRPTVLHGTDAMPPKTGITDEMVLTELACPTDLSLREAGELLEDPSAGFAYLSMRDVSPEAYAARELRVHIKKRPTWAATEKVQRFYTARDADYAVIGFYHSDYEQTFLRLMEEQGLAAGLVVKGEEGTTHLALRSGRASTPEARTLNFAGGFRADPETGDRVRFDRDIDPAEFGLVYSENPRVDPVSAQSFAQAGVTALSGDRGHVYDRIVLNAAAADHLLGLEPDRETAVRRARDAIDSGKALSHLTAYITRAQGLHG
jgi:anthranilate phosphoribosyltransferase